uniref:FGENESH: predicted gene_8.329 protein n=1 Tax=Rhodotorula toruloides TaxID=5286 RepID=A0A0K3CI17_RHOTO
MPEQRPSLRWLALLLLLAPAAHAHMELVSPYAMWSKSDPQVTEDQKGSHNSYSMTSPLKKDGSDFPGKKFVTAEALASYKPVATLVAGQEFSWDLAGTATHNGGSCQVGMSYDLMKTMVVMASWIGGCPLQNGTLSPFPRSTRTSPTLLARSIFWWSWVNETGNREMYQNAAVVSVSGTAKSFTGPQIYRANTFGEGVCVNTEGTDDVFPNPGPQVFYGGKSSASSPKISLNCPGWDNNKMVTVTGTGNGPAAAAGTGSSEFGSGSGAGTGAGSGAGTGTGDTTGGTGSTTGSTGSTSLSANDTKFLMFGGGFLALLLLAGCFIFAMHRNSSGGGSGRRRRYQDSDTSDSSDSSDDSYDEKPGRRHRHHHRYRD